MRTLPLLILVLLAAPAALPAAERVSLESAAIRLELDGAKGTLVALVDKATGRDWIDPASAAPLYSIQLADGTRLDSPPAAVKVTQEPSAIAVESSYGQPAGLVVTCRIRADKGTPHLLGRLAIRTDAPVTLAEVRFPSVALKLPFAGSGAEDRVLRPECDGSLLCDPGSNRGSRDLRYPGSASLQMMAAYDPGAGLYLAARDTAGHAKVFSSRSTGKALELAIGHVLPRSPVTDWELGYDVDLAGLRPSSGMGQVTWEAAADLYRTWAVHQPWCRQTLSERVAAGDVPSWLTKPGLILTFSLRGQLPDGTLGDRLPLLAEQADRWREAVGAPITCLIMSWEKRDTWVTPDYFPPFGGEQAFKAMTKALHERGHRTMVFLSGLHWTLHKDLAGPDRPRVLVDQRAEFEQKGRPWAISDAQGNPDLLGKPTAGVGQHATICAATPLAREILLDTSLRCQALGIDCVQVDQIVGGGMRDCFHPGHGHPPGGGSWCSAALSRIFGEIRREGRIRAADFAFSIEEPNEFYLPLLDTYHARDLHQGRWPRSGAGVLGVPLFTHVYHDYCAGYGSEGCYVSDKPSQFALYQIGMNLVCGKIPAVALWGRWFDPEKLDGAQRRLLRAHLGLWRGPAAEFLNFGQRVTAPEPAVPGMELTFTEKDGKTRRKLTLPSVLQGVWRLADGRTAAILACVGGQPVQFDCAGEKLRLDPGEAVLRPLP